MATAGDILIGAVTLSPFGRTFTEGLIELSRTDRTASGRLVKDVYATKRILTLEYDVITNAALEQYATIYTAGGELILTEYYTSLLSNVYTVLMEPYDKTRLILLDSGLWVGFAATFNEV